MKRYTVYFTRSFYRGNLAGLTHNDKITFPSFRLARDFLTGIRANVNSLDYTIIDYRIKPA